MLTYVINTSDNKTFDSRMLFELAGYSKVRWLHCSLGDIDKTAEYISEKQNVVGAEPFRVAVIVDFYSFNKIRKPYGRDSFRGEDSIDLSLYIPYIEVFLLDHMVAEFERSNLYAEDVEVFYVQNEKSDRYDLFKNAKRQLQDSGVLTGIVETAELIEEKAPAKPAPAVKEPEPAPAPEEEPMPEFDRPDPAWSYSEDEGFEPNPDNSKYLYREFSLYCTPNVSLRFRLADYPYGAEYMSFSEFRDAFRSRQSYVSGLRRHFYVVPYGGGSARAALAMLSLSLYLIRMYEREESVPCDGDMDMLYLDPVLLRDVLETAWNKVTVAKSMVKKGSKNVKYYSLDLGTTDARIEKIPETPAEIQRARDEAMKQERTKLYADAKKHEFSTEQYYRRIMDMADPRSSRFEKTKQTEFDGIMSTYLVKRDSTKEADVKAEFEEKMRAGLLEETDQCPSREEYNHFVEKKEKEISSLFEKALRADYIEVDYTEERETANKVYLDYLRAKACMKRNIIGDIFFFVLTLASVLAPYWFMQLNLPSAQMATSIILLLQTAGLFGGLFLAAMVLRYIPLIRALKRAKRDLRRCYFDCATKRNFSFSSLRTRYEKDLVAIEQGRYDLRQLKFVYDANLEKEKLITAHREMLERLEDCLGGILNNLDVEPVPDPLISVEDELNLQRPVNSKSNKIYQVFSVETIERMLPTKGCDCT